MGSFLCSERILLGGGSPSQRTPPPTNVHRLRLKPWCASMSGLTEPQTSAECGSFLPSVRQQQSCQTMSPSRAPAGCGEVGASSLMHRTGQLSGKAFGQLSLGKTPERHSGPWRTQGHSQGPLNAQVRAGAVGRGRWAGCRRTTRSHFPVGSKALGINGLAFHRPQPEPRL